MKHYFNLGLYIQLGITAKTTACLSFHDSLLFYSRNFYASSGTVVSPVGVQLLLAKGCGLTSRRAVYTAVYSPLQDSSKSQALGTSLSWDALGRKLLTAVGCAVVSLRGTSLDSITRYTSGFHNLVFPHLWLCFQLALGIGVGSPSVPFLCSYCLSNF